MRKSSAFFLSLFFLTACAISNPPSGPGVIITKTRELIYYDGKVVANNEITSCSNNILGIVAYGDNGIDALKAKGDFSKIHSIERIYQNFLLLYAKSCLVVKFG